MLPRSQFEMIQDAFANLDMTPASYSFYYATDVWEKVHNWVEEKPRDIRAVFSTKDILKIIISHIDDDNNFWLEIFTHKGQRSVLEVQYDRQ